MWVAPNRVIRAAVGRRRGDAGLGTRSWYRGRTIAILNIAMTKVRSVPYAEIKIGDRAEFVRQVTEGDVRSFALLSGDTNPVHLDEAYAKTTPFGGRIVHGSLMAAHISAALATKLPGPGTIYLEESLRFRRPARIGDVLTTTLVVEEKRDDRKFVRFEAQVTNQDGTLLATGHALVLAPSERIEVELPERP